MFQALAAPQAMGGGGEEWARGIERKRGYEI